LHDVNKCHEDLQVGQTLGHIGTAMI